MAMCVCVLAPDKKAFLQLLVLSASSLDPQPDVDSPLAFQALGGFHFLFCDVNRKVLFSPFLEIGD